MLIEVDTFFQKNLYSSERLKKRRIRGEKFLFVFFKHEIKKSYSQSIGDKLFAKTPCEKPFPQALFLQHREGGFPPNTRAIFLVFNVPISFHPFIYLHSRHSRECRPGMCTPVARGDASPGKSPLQCGKLALLILLECE